MELDGRARRRARPEDRGRSAWPSLRGGDCHRTVGRARPQEAAPLQPLGKQAGTLAVMPDHLQETAAASTKTKQLATQRIALQISPAPAATGSQSPSSRLAQGISHGATWRRWVCAGDDRSGAACEGVLAAVIAAAAVSSFRRSKTSGRSDCGLSVLVIVPPCERRAGASASLPSSFGHIPFREYHRAAGSRLVDAPASRQGNGELPEQLAQASVQANTPKSKGKRAA